MSTGVPEGVPPDRRSVRPRDSSATVLTFSQEQRPEREPPPGIGGGSRECGGVRTGQNTLTPYALSASVTGWKKVVPPVVQLPLPPEVRPIARVPE